MPNTYGLKKSEHFRQSYYIDCLMANGSYSYSYIITAEKGDKGKWIVFCEEHEPEDLHKSYPEEYPLEGFDTLKDAAKFIWEFVDDFYGLWEENNQADRADAITAWKTYTGSRDSFLKENPQYQCFEAFIN